MSRFFSWLRQALRPVNQPAGRPCTGGQSLEDGTRRVQLAEARQTWELLASSEHPVTGAIYWKYRTLVGHLGRPRGPQVTAGGILRQAFQHGVIYYSAATGAHAILGSPDDPCTFWGRFAAAGCERGLGLPTGDVVEHDNGSKHQDFQKGVLSWLGPLRRRR
jgi:hypothetical protein